MFNNALEEQEEIYIKMLMRLALTNPQTLKEYKWTDKKNTTLLPNDTTNAWHAAYNMLGGVYKKCNQDRKLTIFQELQEKKGKKN